MSKIFRGNLDLDAMELFKSRKDYFDFAIPRNALQMIDFWNKDYLYGKVDADGDSVYPILNTSYVLEQVVENDIALATPFYVNRILEQLKSDYSLLTINKNVKPLPSYDTFSIKKAVVSLDDIYSKYRASLLDYFVNDYLYKRRNCIRKFEHIVEHFVKFMKSEGSKFPITKSSFIMLPRVTNSISGLVLDLDFGDENDNTIKQQFFQDKCSFEAFQSAAAKNGFFMDRNAPWRLVANLRSPEFIRKAFPINPCTTDCTKRFFSEYYSKAFHEDYYLVSNFITNAFGLFFVKYPDLYIDKKDISGRMNKVVVERFIESDTDLSSNQSFWMSLVLVTRISELPIKRSRVPQILDQVMLTSANTEQSFRSDLDAINSAAKLNDPRLKR